MVSLLLVAGGCRFALGGAAANQTPLDCAAGDTAVLKVFASGVDYWQRKRHGGHSWTMRRVVLALMLARQRLDATRPVALAAPALVHLPEEIWLLVCGFLRSADFSPR